VATLRNISSAQAQFQATAKADTDGDGTGEFGCFQELPGSLNVRNSATVGKLNPPVLSGAFRVPDALGTVSRSGYFFLMLLPDDEGTGLAVDMNAAVLAAIDSDMTETTWCCYALPVNYGNSGNRTFMVNQGGDIVSTDNRNYSGPDHTAAGHLEGGSAYITPRTAQSITGQIAVGTAGGDGNVWRQVNWCNAARRSRLVRPPGRVATTR
jgi:hypothetical protein